MSNCLITKSQQALFWKLFRRAWAANCARSGMPPDLKVDADAWRHSILNDTAGNPSIKRLRQNNFDRVMLRLAMETNDQREIEYWAVATDRRLRFLIENTLRKMSKLDSTREFSWNYVVTTYRQANLPLNISDAPAEYLHKVFQMLDTHLRRLKSRHCHAGTDAPF